MAPLYLLSRAILNHYQYKFGICIPYNTNISAGLYIGHFGGIFIHNSTNIGKNCNISQDVSIGVKNGGKNPGVPSIGDNVYLGSGSKIMGGIRIGNNAAVGANCVVNISIPENGVAIGNPCRIVSLNGSLRYISNTDYDLQNPEVATVIP